MSIVLVLAINVGSIALEIDVDIATTATKKPFAQSLVE